MWPAQGVVWVLWGALKGILVLEEVQLVGHTLTGVSPHALRVGWGAGCSGTSLQSMCWAVACHRGRVIRLGCPGERGFSSLNGISQ